MVLYLVDDETSWPDPGKLYIDGLTYGPFVSHVTADSKSRLRWLSLRNPEDLSVQPYEQLSSVYRHMGLPDEAREVAIAKQRAIHKHRPRSFGARTRRTAMRCSGAVTGNVFCKFPLIGICPCAVAHRIESTTHLMMRPGYCII